MERPQRSEDERPDPPPKARGWRQAGVPKRPKRPLGVPYWGQGRRPRGARARALSAWSSSCGGVVSSRQGFGGLASRCAARRRSRPAGSVARWVGIRQGRWAGRLRGGTPLRSSPCGLAGGSGTVSLRCGPGARWRSFGIRKRQVAGLASARGWAKAGIVPVSAIWWGRLGHRRRGVAGSLACASGSGRRAGAWAGWPGHPFGKLRTSAVAGSFTSTALYKSQGAIRRRIGGVDADEWCPGTFSLICAVRLLRWRAGAWSAFGVWAGWRWMGAARGVV